MGRRKKHKGEKKVHEDELYDEVVTEKVHDFGVFGKWSETTLKVQSSLYVYPDESFDLCLPEGIQSKINEFSDDVSKIEMQKVKGLNVGELKIKLDLLQKIEDHIKEEDKMRAVIRSIYKRGGKRG